MLKKTVFFAAALMFVAAFVFAAGDAVACGNNASKASDTKMIGDKSACGAKTGEAKLTEARMIGDKSACGAKMGMIDAQTAGAKMTEGKMSQPMDFEGTLVCQACDLKNAEGARAECKTYGHTHALKTSDGHLINFLPNKYAADLMAGEKYHNQKVKVHGVYFANANQLDVETFEVDGKKMGWCEHCSAMDVCMAGKMGATDSKGAY
ncbi:MAG: hypothetical protein OEW00_09510 [candidate division Zixibacteria bacterium]|nr:hypothetical protein [candidate division Zixibacteria bacterium]